MRGGTSSEYSLSLKTGAAMLAALPEDRYETRDIFIDRAGIWHQRGIPMQPARAVQQIDVVLNALHGGMGEDGTVQRFLKRAGVAYAGASPLGSSISIDKIRTHELLEQADILMPHAAVFGLDDDMDTAQMAQFVFSQFAPPYIVKPPREGNGNGIRLAATIIALPDAIADVLDVYGSALVEEYIQGDHVEAAVIEGFRNEGLYVTPPAQQKIPEGSRIIEPHHYESGVIAHVCPTDFSRKEKTAIANTARRAHQVLGMDHFSHLDMIRTPHGIYLLELNSVPSLYEGASLQPMLETVGATVPQFLEHQIALARARK